MDSRARNHGTSRNSVCLHHFERHDVLGVRWAQVYSQGILTLLKLSRGDLVGGLCPRRTAFGLSQ